MREILFRGKRLDNGEWVHGRLLADDVIVPLGQDFEIEGNKVYGCDLTAYEVVHATVGQWTGLVDKNGKKVFEDDILKITDKYGHLVLWRVTYKSASFCVDQKGVNYSTYLGDFPDGYYLLETVGNIHDTPDLLTAC